METTSLENFLGKENKMKYTKQQVEVIKINDIENLDPITVYIDEQKDNEYNKNMGRITIICYDTVLSYFWGSMGSSIKEFFCEADTGYLINKFEQTARRSFNPYAVTGFYDENGEWQEEEATVAVEMQKSHREYLCRIIEVVKEVFKTQLKGE